MSRRIVIYLVYYRPLFVSLLSYLNIPTLMLQNTIGTLVLVI